MMEDEIDAVRFHRRDRSASFCRSAIERKRIKGLQVPEEMLGGEIKFVPVNSEGYYPPILTRINVSSIIW